MKRSSKKVTVELPEDTYWKFKVQCATNRTSMHAVLVEYVEQLCAEEGERDDLDHGDLMDAADYA